MKIFLKKLILFLSLIYTLEAHAYRFSSNLPHSCSSHRRHKQSGYTRSSNYTKSANLESSDESEAQLETNCFEEDPSITNMDDNQKWEIDYAKLSAQSIRVLLAANKRQEYLKKCYPEVNSIALDKEAKLALEKLYFKKCNFMQKLSYKILGISQKEGFFKKTSKEAVYVIYQNSSYWKDDITAADSNKAMEYHIMTCH